MMTEQDAIPEIEKKEADESNESIETEKREKKNWPIWLGAGVGAIIIILAGWAMAANFKSEQLDKYKTKADSTKFDFNNTTSIENLSEGKFTDEEKKAILSDGFVVRPYTKEFYRQDPKVEVPRNDDWTDIYGDFGGGNICTRESGNAVYVTADTAMHIYHKLFDLELEYLEDTKFLPMLQQLTEELLAEVTMRANQATGADEKESYERLSAYLAVPAALLRSVDLTPLEYTDVPAGYMVELDETKVKTEMAGIMAKNLTKEQAAMATAELEQVLAATEGLGFSEVTGQNHDYTQYTARGHYNKNSLGQAYFKAMMWYGRSNFALNSIDKELNAKKTLDALNLVSALEATENGMTLWQNLKEPIDYLVGNADDLTVPDYQNFAKNGLNLQTVTELLPEMQKLKKPQIMSAVIIDPAIMTRTKEEVQGGTQAFQLFSQRFTPDAYIFTNLTQGDEVADAETGEKLPSMPTALMVPTAFGNEFAAKQLAEWEKTEAPESKKVLAKKMKLLQDEFAGWDEEAWTKNNYVSWLYTLQSLKDGGTPGLMTKTGTQAKNLNTFLGSYTELKHDTILYAKQSYAEMGGGGDCEIPAVPYGYVEPNLEFWQRLTSLVQKNRDWLAQSGLIEEEDALTWRLDAYLEDLNFYQKVVKSQINSEKLTEDEYESLRTITAGIDGVLGPIFPVARLEDNARSALITDVATDIKTSQILYEANAIPDEIVLAVDDFNGRRLVRGLTYSYREFTGPLTTRETDESWKAKVYQREELPAQPNWWTPYFGK